MKNQKNYGGEVKYDRQDGYTSFEILRQGFMGQACI